MKKIIAIVSAVAIVVAMAVPASAATGGFDISKAQPSINKAITEIVTAPTFDWSAWLARIVEGWR